MALRCRVGISPQDRPPVPLAIRSLLLRYGNAAGGEEVSPIRVRSGPTNAVRDFIRFTGISRPEEFRTVTRAHVIAWRDDLESREIGSDNNRRNPEGATIRHRLAALSSLFEHL